NSPPPPPPQKKKKKKNQKKKKKKKKKKHTSGPTPFFFPLFRQKKILTHPTSSHPFPPNFPNRENFDEQTTSHITLSPISLLKIYHSPSTFFLGVGFFSFFLPLEKYWFLTLPYEYGPDTRCMLRFQFVLFFFATFCVSFLVKPPFTHTHTLSLFTPNSP
ncbi:hypothetical protein, partial [Devosia indica]